MAYRRRQGLSRISTRRYNQDDDDPTMYVTTSSCYSPSSALASQALRASAARRDSNIYAKSSPQGPTYDYTSYRTSNDQSGGFWSVLARKAKSVLDEDNVHEQITRPNQIPYGSTHAPNDQYYDPRKSHEYSRPIDNPPFRKGLDALTSSINQIGGSIGNALEDGRSKVENRTSDIHQDTQHMHTRRKGTDQEEHAHVPSIRNPWQEQQTNTSQQRTQTNQQTQLKASRDVAMATAAKAKLLLRELKTVKADLAFSKQRCYQLEEENKMLREANEKGDHPADDDMIRLQLETLLAEKARLAHENSVYARENRFLREIVEYHQLTMQDVVYLDDEEVTEVYPLSRMLSDSPPALQSPSPERSPSRSPPPVENGNFHAPTTMQTKSSQSNTQTRAKSNDTAPAATQLQAFADVLENEAPTSSASSVSSTEASGQRNSSAA